MAVQAKRQMGFLAQGRYIVFVIPLSARPNFPQYASLLRGGHQGYTVIWFCFLFKSLRKYLHLM